MQPDIAVVGGGLLGRCLAWRASKAGARVVLYEAASKRGEGSVFRLPAVIGLLGDAMLPAQLSRGSITPSMTQSDPNCRMIFRDR